MVHLPSQLVLIRHLSAGESLSVAFKVVDGNSHAYFKGFTPTSPVTLDENNQTATITVTTNSELASIEADGAD